MPPGLPGELIFIPASNLPRIPDTDPTIVDYSVNPDLGDVEFPLR